MPTLLELQRDVAAGVLPGDPVARARAVAAIAGSAAAAEGRFAVHRNTTRVTLAEALAAVFPTLGQLVGPGFFAFAADRYIHDFPPDRPCLFEYGAGFPAYLAGLPACRDLAYLDDVGRLEWAANEAVHAPAAAPLPLAALAGVAPDAAGRLRLTLDPSLRLIAAAWPADAILAAHRPGAVPGPLAVAPERVWIEVRRHGEDVVHRRLEPGDFACRAALAAGRSLGAALVVGADTDPGFDPAAAIARLFGDGLVAAFTLPSDPESAS